VYYIQLDLDCSRGGLPAKLPIVQVVLDGEILGTTPVKAKVLPGSLKVLVPPPAPEGAAEEAETEAGVSKAAASE
jgi:hypothetical protein